jgi:hypothetical protein
VIAPVGAGIGVLAVGVVTGTGWMDWSALGRWLRQHSRQQQPPREPTASALSWWTVAAAGAVVVGVAWAAIAWLLSAVITSWVSTVPMRRFLACRRHR